MFFFYHCFFKKSELRAVEMNFKRGVAAFLTNIKTDLLKVQKRLIVM